MHLGGTPALHAYASQFGSPHLEPFRGGDISAAPPGR
jgi:hypothetical protein